MDANQARDLELIRQIRANVPGAMEALVEKYVPLVRHIARHHYAKRMDFEDLFQEGLIGLLHAVEEYRPDRYDVKFSSFAYLCITRKVYNVIKQTNGRKHRVLNDAVSLQSFVSWEENRTLLDLWIDENQVDPQRIVEEKLTATDLRRLLRNHLSLLEYTVLGLLLQGFTCSDIERRIGVSAKAVDNARTRVKMKLRRLLDRYGSLLSPQVPQKARRRRDLYVNLRLEA